ncbi:MAG: hypothetical protein R3320_07630, partial [Nitriliruptorales bacterium]|nr:hypothetical protein [Nitriliruptorales bacterium]
MVAPRLHRKAVGRVLLGIGVAGVVLAIVGTIVGWRLLAQLDGALESTLGATEVALDALDSSVALADVTVSRIEGTLESTGSSTADLGVAIEDAAVSLDGIAALSENEVADSLAAVERSLPALIDVASVIDTTLGALSRVPFGPEYDPDEPFDDSLREIQREMDGLPEGLREQASLIRDGRDSLRELGTGVEDLAEDLETMAGVLSAADALLDDYAAAADQARGAVDESVGTLDTQLTVARWLVVGLGLVLAVGQLVPVGAGWL